jgi:hypothetical protein
MNVVELQTIELPQLLSALRTDRLLDHDFQAVEGSEFASLHA